MYRFQCRKMTCRYWLQKPVAMHYLQSLNSYQHKVKLVLHNCIITGIFINTGPHLFLTIVESNLLLASLWVVYEFDGIILSSMFGLQFPVLSIIINSNHNICDWLVLCWFLYPDSPFYPDSQYILLR